MIGPASKIRLTAACLLVFGAAAFPCAAAESGSGGVPGRLVWRKDADGGGALIWQTKSGRHVRLRGMNLTLADEKDSRTWAVEHKSVNPTLRQDSATLSYRISLGDTHRSVTGLARLLITVSNGNEDALLCRSSLKFDQAANMDVTVQYTYDVRGALPKKISLPERAGRLAMQSLRSNTVEGGYFRLGMTTTPCGLELGMPVLDLSWNDAAGEAEPLRLAVTADPYCGCSISAVTRPDTTKPLTRVVVSMTYKGSLVPLTSENRTISLEFHRNGVDGSLRSFYRTIPEIEPGPAWTHGIHLVYYDYLSERGEGWFKDLRTLADRIPPKHRGRVAVCLHGWYDYFQQYAYDHHRKKLMQRWTAFPGTYKVPMSLEKMHERLRFAKDFGFRVLLYFADGTNSDSGAPNFHQEYLLQNKDGKTFPGWKGPDSLGQPLKMDPSVPELRDWHRSYLGAVLEEFSEDFDGFVWDETFYIPTDFISYPKTTPAYADRAMMSLMSELTCMVQLRRSQNPELVFLASDCGKTSYALVAHGTFQDSACSPALWGPSMFANYRNCLWSCNWFPVSGERKNQIAATRFGLPQGISNGYGDDQGPYEMPPEILGKILDRFNKNVTDNRVRRWFLGTLER